MSQFDINAYPPGMCCREHGPVVLAYWCKRCLARSRARVDLEGGPHNDNLTRKELWEEADRMAAMSLGDGEGQGDA